MNIKIHSLHLNKIKLTQFDANGLVSLVAVLKDRLRNVLSRSAKAAYLSDSGSFVTVTGSERLSNMGYRPWNGITVRNDNSIFSRK